MHSKKTGATSMTNSPVCVCFHYKNTHQGHGIIQGTQKPAEQVNNERAARQDRCFPIKAGDAFHCLWAVGRLANKILKVNTNTFPMHSHVTLVRYRDTQILHAAHSTLPQKQLPHSTPNSTLSLLRLGKSEILAALCPFA